MRRLLLLLAVFGLFWFMMCRRSNCSGCSTTISGVDGKGPAKTETRTVTDFHGVQLDVSADMEVHVGSAYAVEVETHENLLSLLQTRVEGGILRIYFEENIGRIGTLNVRVTAPQFDQFSLVGSGDINIPDRITTNRLRLDVSGSGDIHLREADAGMVDCHIGGSGSIEVGGKTNDLKASIGGSGEIKARQLEAANADISIGGSGSVTCHVTGKLKADIGGSGNVHYSGSPTVESNIGGSGEVKKL